MFTIPRYSFDISFTRKLHVFGLHFNTELDTLFGKKKKKKKNYSIASENLLPRLIRVVWNGSSHFEESLTNFSTKVLRSSPAMMSHKPLCTCNSSSHRPRIPMRRALLRHHTQSPPQSSIRPGRGSINYQGHPIGKSNCERLDRK